MTIEDYMRAINVMRKCKVDYNVKVIDMKNQPDPDEVEIDIAESIVRDLSESIKAMKEIEVNPTVWTGVLK